MSQRWSNWCWTFGLASSLTLGGAIATCLGNPTLAQVTPDTTLGAEQSVVTNGVEIRGETANRIDGGAQRGANLFHSFSKFDVQEGQRVYFANPAGIETILSRVTGTDPSDILGTLGVDGTANLFLLNPNGIIFGPNARLDIAGSFVASTANSLVFENGLHFSATNPQAPPLLTINLTPGLQYGSNQPKATIANAGNLASGQDLTLAASNLDLQGQLQAGRDLSLLATDTVQVRDSIANPFIATAFGQLLVQGDRTVDISAFNHPQSGFFSGEALVLRSPNSVRGDAYYTTGGNFRIEQLDGTVGNLFSPDAAIIRAGGDVNINTYLGASLHIFAGGQVNLGTVTITDAATGAAGINFIAGNVPLSNGTLLAIDGSVQPTLDVRAGMNPAEIMGSSGLSDIFNVLNSPNPVVPTPTSADISIGSITMQAPNGMVFLTNQYKPDLSLPSGAIAVGKIRTNDAVGRFSGNSGSVFIDSRSGVTVGNEIVTSSRSGNAGDITLVAKDAIKLDGSRIVSATSGSGQGGDIRIQGGSFLLTNAGKLQSNTSGSGDAGDVTILASGQVSIGGGTGNDKEGIIVSGVTDKGSGASGDITIEAESVFVLARLNSETKLEARNRAQGSGGNITIIARDTVSFDGAGAYSSVESGGIGNAGSITITGRAVSIVHGSLQSNTLGVGDAGNIRIVASDSVLLDDLYLLSRVNPSGKGNGGNITIETGSLVANGTRLISETQGQGNAGNVTILARDSVSFDGSSSFNSIADGNLGGAFSSVESGAVGKGGDIFIQAGSLSLTNSAQLVTKTHGQGDAGNVTILARDSVSFDAMGEESQLTGIYSSIDAGGVGKGGDIQVQADSLSVINGARLDASTGAEGDAGNLALLIGQLSVRDGGTISASTMGHRDAGNMTIKATESVVIANDGLISSGVAVDATGNGGNIEIETPFLSLINGGRVETRTLGFIPVLLVTGTAQQYANTPYDVAVQADQPVAYWHLDETSGVAAFDASGNNFNGIYQGGVTLGQAGVSGAAAEFDGSNGLVDVGSITAGSGLDIKNQSFTVEAWIKPDESPSRQQVYFGMHSNNAQVRQSLHLRVYPNGSTRFGYLHNDLNTSPGTLTFGDNWYHVVARYDQASDTSTIFVNGNPIARGFQGPFVGNAPSVVIGNWVNINNSSIKQFNQPFDGLIDEVAVYNTALSTESIAAHYAIGQRNLGIPMTLTDNGANAGNITVKADLINLSGVSSSQGLPSGFFSDTEGQYTGQGGNINVTTNFLGISNGAQLSTRSGGSANAGNLDITARSVALNNQGKFTAETASGNGGNIRLQVQDVLLLRRNSEISTKAGSARTGGNGGNMTIDAGFIGAIPEEDSNITADAFQGRGGNINIRAQGVFGIDSREDQTSLSDITATSKLGVDGTVKIHRLDVDPSRGLAELPTDLVDAQGLVDRSCTSDRNSTQTSSFTVTGRGGLPPSPRDSLSSDAVEVPWVALNPEAENRSSLAVAKNSMTPASTAIVEAQGWFIDDNGQVVLTATAPNITPHNSWRPSVNCGEGTRG